MFNATIKTKGANDKLIPLKRNGILEQTDKYGGYDSASTAHFALVKSVDKKGKALLTLEAIPIYIVQLGDLNAINKYLATNSGLINPQIMLDKIKLNSLIKLNGAYYWLRGKTGAQIILCNSNQLVVDEESAAYLKKIVAFFEKQKRLNKKELEPNEEFDKISIDKNIALYDVLLAKLANVPYCNIAPLKVQLTLLNEKRPIFIALSIKDQIRFLLEVLHLLQCNVVPSDLSLVGGAAHAGVLLHSKKISQDEDALLITQSPTGYYKKTVDLTAYYNL